jgi:hypothetical protein
MVTPWTEPVILPDLTHRLAVVVPENTCPGSSPNDLYTLTFIFQTPSPEHVAVM